MTAMPWVSGTLLRRYKRFLADVRLADGREVVAHCPNTGSMRAVDVPGCRVWLSPSTNPARKLAWTWELIELPRGENGGGEASSAEIADGVVDWASVHTGRANALVDAALRRAMIAELGPVTELKREAVVTTTIDRARLDFRLRDADGRATFVEVKQVTLKEPDGHGYFPDAVSERGRRHLRVLAELAAQGYRSVLLFCAAHTGIDDVAPAAHLDPAYAATLAEVAAQGVEILAYGCRRVGPREAPHGLEIDRRLPVDLGRRYSAP